MRSLVFLATLPAISYAAGEWHNIEWRLPTNNPTTKFTYFAGDFVIPKHPSRLPIPGEAPYVFPGLVPSVGGEIIQAVCDGR
jgi:hypothetical protein